MGIRYLKKHAVLEGHVRVDDAEALAQWLQAQGVFDAVNLDGGGSSALFVQGRSLAARPANEPAQRAVANALRIVPRPAADTAPAR